MAKKSLKFWVLGCWLFVLVFPFGALADTVYVHPTEGPFYTIAEAVLAAADGDTIMVGPGDYGSFVVSKKLAIVSEEGPEKTTITSGGSVTFNDGADQSLFTGFTVTVPAGNGITVNSNCDYLRIENNIISGCGGNGIYAYSASSDDINYLNILNNTISLNNGNGIRFSREGTAYDEFRFCTAANNIIFENTSYGISSNDAGHIISCTFANNNFWGNTLGPTSGVTADTSGGNLFLDPLLLDPDTGDFHLQAASDCIDAGMAGAIYVDPDGTRNDMGVYGGPGSAGFWPNPAGGPVVTSLAVTPPSVPAGGYHLPDSDG